MRLELEQLAHVVGVELGHPSPDLLAVSNPTMSMIAREAIVVAARGWLGTPYHHQASLRGVGCDCLGLIRGVWRELVGPEPQGMPAYTRDWGDATGSEPLLAAALKHLV